MWQEELWQVWQKMHHQQSDQRRSVSCSTGSSPAQPPELVQMVLQSLVRFEQISLTFTDVHDSPEAEEPP